MLFFCLAEAIAQIVGVCLVCLHEINRDIDDDPVIRRRVIHGQFVEVIVPYEYDIIGLQVIGFAFYKITDTALKEYGDLVKIVVVVFDFAGLLVCQMEQAEFTVQIAFFNILIHGTPPF